MAWQEPITDRTNEDITNKTPKAYLKIADLNRIESNIAQIASDLNVTVTTKTWTAADFPTAAEFQRLIQNVNTIRAAAYVKQSTPSTPTQPINIYWKVNNIEQITKDIYDIFTSNKLARSFTGEFYAGEGGLT